MGLACLVKHDVDSRLDLSPWLANVIVSPQHRGQGIGTELSQAASTEAGRLGYERLFLVTFDKVEFYGRLGWTRVEDVTYFDEPATIMELSLPIDGALDR